MKNSCILLILLIAFTYQVESDDSGIKFAINVKALQRLKDFPFEVLITNTTFLPQGKTFGDSITNLKISNVKLQNIEKPQSIEASSDTPSNPSIDLVIRNGEFDFIMDIEITTFYFVHSYLQNALVKVPIEELVLRAGIDRTNNNLEVENISLTLGEIEVPFSNVIYKAVLFILNKLSSFIVKIFSSAISNEINVALNNFMRSPIVANKLGGVFDIDFSLTKSLDIVNHPLQNTTLNTYLTLGDKALITSANPYHFYFAGLKPLKFSEVDFQHELSLLVSDYFVNSIFYIIQQLNIYAWSVPMDNFPEIPYSLDVDSFSSLVPELKTYFKQNYSVNYEVNVDPFNNVQPVISTVNGVSRLSINFNTSIYVSNFSPDSFQNPVLAVSFNTTSSFDLIFGSKILDMTFDNMTIDYFGVNSQIGNIDIDGLKSRVANLIVNSFPIFSQNVKNFNFKKFIHSQYNGFNENTNLTDFYFENNRLVSGDGFIHVLLDAK